MISQFLPRVEGSLHVSFSPFIPSSLVADGLQRARTGTQTLHLEEQEESVHRFRYVYSVAPYNALPGRIAQVSLKFCHTVPAQRITDRQRSFGQLNW